MKTKSKFNGFKFVFSRKFAIVLVTVTSLFLAMIPAPMASASDGPITVTGNYTLDSDKTFSSTGFIIAADNITLDLGGHTITGSTTGRGVEVIGHNNVTIKNGTITHFATGVYLDGSTGNVVQNIVSTTNTYGIVVLNSDGNSLIGNTTTGNSSCGVFLYNGADGNTVRDSTSSNNSGTGIVILNSDGNSLIGNIILGNSNAITGSIVNGISLVQGADNNIVRNNRIENNKIYGIYIAQYGGPVPSNNNTVYNNNFISNPTQAVVSGGSNNRFNLDKPIGGNYWSNWNSPDANQDGFVDSAYCFTGACDSYPYATQNAWPIILTDDFTLTSDRTFGSAGFIIAANDITLDLGGHTITGSFPLGANTWGVDLSGHSGITVKNGTIQGFGFGVTLDGSDYNTIDEVVVTHSKGNGISLLNDSDNNVVKNCVVTNSGLGGGDYAGIIMNNSSDNNTIKDTNSSNNSRYGISIVHSDGNSLIGNTTNGNLLYGVVISVGSDNNVVQDSTSNHNIQYGILISGTGTASTGNSLIGNTTTGNSSCGVFLYNGADGNTVRDSTSSNNSGTGIVILNSDGNSLIGNIILGNSNAITGSIVNGISLVQGADNNIVRNNRIENNKIYGIYIAQYGGPVPSNNNTVYNNNFISNPTQAVVSGGSNNRFNLDIPIGGNYWSDWTTPDTDYDGFVDSPKTFTGGQDNLPWAVQNGWLDKTPPTITITVPVDGGVYLLNQVENASWSVADTESGVNPVTVIATTANGLPIETSIAGNYSFTISARDYAGNEAVETVNYQVYGFSGFLPPVVDGRVFKLGSTIPVKFQLTDASGGFITDATAKISVQKLADGTPEGEIVDGISTSAATEGNLFRYDPTSDQYIFNLATKTLVAGSSYCITITVNGTGIASVVIGLK